MTKRPNSVGIDLVKVKWPISQAVNRRRELPEFSHFDEQGNSRMVNVGDKPETERMCRASGLVSMKTETLRRIQNSDFEKGNVLEVARLAGIMASKKTSDIIPLCHPLRIDSVTIDFSFPTEDMVMIEAVVLAHDRTGVEMEALHAVSATALTIYDMCKSVDREMSIDTIRLEEKTGGKSGHFVRRNNESKLP